MGIKEKIFIAFLIAVIFFPFFVSKKDIKIEKQINLPNVSVKDGLFFKYSPYLQRKGTFKTLDIFSENNYISKNVNVRLLDKNSTFIAKSVTFNKIYHFIKGRYIMPEYTYLADYGTYNDKKDILNAYQFEFFNNKIDGKGDEMIYKNNIITAKNIQYTIKGLK